MNKTGCGPLLCIALIVGGFLAFWYVIHTPVHVAPRAPIAAQTSQPTTQGYAPVSGATCALGVLPDPKCSPGAVQSTDAAAICTPGWASAHRDVPLPEWDQVFAEYGVTRHTSATYEVDHVVALEIGGSNDISNLYPESAAGPLGYHVKDETENAAHDAVCSGRITLGYAQQQMATDWTVLFHQLIG
jgi:hypothetical protein